MSSPTSGLRVASAFFGLICIAHVLRILLRVSVVVGGHPVGRKISAVAVVVTGALALWLWLLSTRTAAPAAPGGTPPAA